jgi:hypothetical protein
MTFHHEANRRRWDAGSALWAIHADSRGIWKNCHHDPALTLHAAELTWLSDIAGKDIAGAVRVPLDYCRLHLCAYFIGVSADPRRGIRRCQRKLGGRASGRPSSCASFGWTPKPLSPIGVRCYWSVVGRRGAGKNDKILLATVTAVALGRSLAILLGFELSRSATLSFPMLLRTSRQDGT